MSQTGLSAAPLAGQGREITIKSVTFASGTENVLSRPSRPPLTLPCDSYHHLNVLNKDTFRNVACIHLRRRARRGNLASARLFALRRTEPDGCERRPTSFNTQRVFSVQGVSGHRGRVESVSLWQRGGCWRPAQENRAPSTGRASRTRSPLPAPAGPASCWPQDAEIKHGSSFLQTPRESNALGDAFWKHSLNTKKGTV